MTLKEVRSEEMSTGRNGTSEFAIAALLERLCLSSLNDDDAGVAELSMLLRHALQNDSGICN